MIALKAGSTQSVPSAVTAHLYKDLKASAVQASHQLCKLLLGCIGAAPYCIAFVASKKRHSGFALHSLSELSVSP